MKQTRLIYFIAVFWISCSAGYYFGQNQTISYKLNKSKTLRFTFPSVAKLIDSLHVKMYYVEIDSSLALQTHIFDKAQFNSQKMNSVVKTALVQNNNDTLRMIANMVLLTTNSELLSLTDVFLGTFKGLEASYKIRTDDSGIATISFHRFYIIGKDFITFTVTGKELDLPRIILKRNDFFNSISL